MGIWTALVAGLFLYVGSNFLLANVITGSATGETVTRVFLPITLAVVVIGIMVKVFR